MEAEQAAPEELLVLAQVEAEQAAPEELLVLAQVEAEQAAPEEPLVLAQAGLAAVDYLDLAVADYSAKDFQEAVEKKYQPS